MRILASLALLLACPEAAAQERASPLTGRERTAHFELHFRPGSRAEASVDRLAAVVEDDLARILKELGLPAFPYTIRLFLYDDVAELQKVTGVSSGGHSSPLESHVPHDNDQTRVHELVHVVAEKFSEHGPEDRNLFMAEGLANAVLRFVTGVPVDAVAAFYRRRGQLPAMAEVHALKDFYAWLGQHPGVNGYDIAGSWMRYLLDTYGADKVRQYYKGVPVREAFGAELAAIEQGWHARLEKVQLRPGLLALLTERAAVTAAERNPGEAELGPRVLGPAAEWQSLGAAQLHAGDPARGEQHGGLELLLLSGDKTQGDWCVARLGKLPFCDAIVRCTAEPLAGCYGVQIQLGGKCQGMVLRGQGAFLYNEAGAAGHDAHAQLGQQPVQIVLRRQGGKASVWIDGKMVAEAAVDGTAAPLGIGCVGGKARFSAVAVRKL
ncbi:MAG TPA: hypothetical protein VK348_03200 [Planctomycetota bacterium]|nr:hypothetical protein [Planctomycetota bacterium]